MREHYDPGGGEQHVGPMRENYTIRILTFEGYETIVVDAGSPVVERVIPPAGEAFAFERVTWKRRIEIAVSPTGRSARVWVDGKEIKHDG